MTICYQQGIVVIARRSLRLTWQSRYGADEMNEYDVNLNKTNLK